MRCLRNCPELVSRFVRRTSLSVAAVSTDKDVRRTKVISRHFLSQRNLDDHHVPPVTTLTRATQVSARRVAAQCRTGTLSRHAAARLVSVRIACQA